MRFTADHATDVVVLGAGIAGLSVAASLLEAGSRVTILEKQGHHGGSSSMSGGWFAFSGTDEQLAAGVRDSRKLFLDDLLAVGNFENDPALVDAYLTHQREAYLWLRSKGVEFTELEMSSGQTVPRSHLSDIKKVLNLLLQECLSAGVTFRPYHRGITLLRGDGEKVTGVVAKSPEGTHVFEARRGVVLATGGFSRGTDLLKIFAPAQLAGLPYGGLGSTGDGLKMAWKLGAALADMGHISATYGSHPETGLEFHELLTAFYLGAIIVNRDGRRFIDESLSYKTIGTAALAQPAGLGFQVFDAPIRAQSSPGVPLKDMDMLERVGHLFHADTLTELADLAGIDATNLEGTVSSYNAAVHAGADDILGRRGLSMGAGKLVPIATPPFYAYPAKSLMTSTFGGVAVRPDARVVDIDGDIIGGLFATGEVMGGFHGAAYMTGTSLGKGLVFGRIAARTLAAS